MVCCASVWICFSPLPQIVHPTLVDRHYYVICCTSASIFQASFNILHYWLMLLWAFFFWLLLSGCQSREIVFTQHQLDELKHVECVTRPAHNTHIYSGEKTDKCFASSLGRCLSLLASSAYEQCCYCQSPVYFIHDWVLLSSWMSFYNMEEEEEEEKRLRRIPFPLFFFCLLFQAEQFPLGNHLSVIVTQLCQLEREHTLEHTRGKFLYSECKSDTFGDKLSRRELQSLLCVMWRNMLK